MITTQEIKQRFGIIGSSPALERAIEKAAIVAPTDISVLVSGESGVGKENIPRIIHALSPRKHKPYIAVNCGAIPEGTIESELFGHEKGSFTGAAGARKGYFEVADGGTIFLDEVGELPLMTQVRLLRVLEAGEFLKVGSSAIQKTNVRVVAATNRDLLKAIHDGHFREDLYYRLNTVEISLPPLRGRREDIYLLFRKFASDFALKYHMPAVRLSEDAVEMIQNFSWPGNIRQLRNFTEQISLMESNKYVDSKSVLAYLPSAGFTDNLPAKASSANFNSQDVQTLAHSIVELKMELDDLKRTVSKIISSDSFSRPIKDISTQHSLPAYKSDEQQNFNSEDSTIDIHYDDDTLALEKNEIEMISKALARHKSKRKDAARELGISERTLYRKIKQYDL